MTLFRLLFVALAIFAFSVSAASAAAVKGDDASVARKNCSVLRGDESVRFGRCEDVCAGKEVTKDPSNKYGGQYTCTESSRLNTILVNPKVAITGIAVTR